MACWGDSLTAPHVSQETLKLTVKSWFKPDDSYPAVMQEEIGDDYEVTNCGVGGENTLTIMGRQGAAPMRLAHDITIFDDSKRAFVTFIGNNDIPAFISSWKNEAVKPFLKLGYSRKSPAKKKPLKIDDHLSELSSESRTYDTEKGKLYEYNYYIRPLTKTSHTYVLPQDSEIKTYAMEHLRGAYANIFFIGQNGGYADAAELIEQIKSMIHYSKSTRYIVISFHKPNKIFPTTQRMEEMEDSMHAEFGTHFINLRQYMVTNGLKEAGYSATQEDMDSINHGRVAPQLLTDGAHFNTEGYKVLGKLVAKKFKQLGY